jgi:hypothetical protein
MGRCRGREGGRELERGRVGNRKSEGKKRERRE